MMDGDGCIQVDKRNGSISIELVGSLAILEQWCEFCRPLHPNKKRYPNGKLYTPKPVRGGPLHRVRIGGPVSHVVLAKMYAEGPALPRKKATWDAWVDSDWVSGRGRAGVSRQA